MSTRQVVTQLSVQQLLGAIKQLSADEQHEFERQFKAWQSQADGAQRQAGRRVRDKSSETEEDLLARIRLNSRLPENAQRRHNRLRRKFQDETISEAELRELQGLTSRLEWMAVERLEALIELARRRGTELDTLMRELGLHKKRRVF